MPTRDDITSILPIGSGPVVIGQACERDDSRTQACRPWLEEDHRVMRIHGTPTALNNTLCQPSIGPPD